MTRTLKAIEDEGRTRGRMIALWVDVSLASDPEIATAIMVAAATRAERNNRVYLEFEPIRHELNMHPQSYNAWAAFDRGVVAGIRQGVAESLNRRNQGDG